uniref:Uncharacterized protein n=1 Tax=Rhizophora mucronata TaxID=61149 RepID=A0A2P2MNG8_RHIMU
MEPTWIDRSGIFCGGPLNSQQTTDRQTDTQITDAHLLLLHTSYQKRTTFDVVVFPLASRLKTTGLWTAVLAAGGDPLERGGREE